MGYWRVAVAALVLGMGSAAAAAAAAEQMVMLSDDSAIAYGPPPASLPPGLQFAVIAGNPDHPGPFTLRIKLPANFVIAPHTHATSENLTVLSGAIVHDIGNTLVRTRGKPLATGGFVFLPGNTPHALWTNAQPAEIQVTGTGPFGLHYINPKDDPRNTRHS